MPSGPRCGICEDLFCRRLYFSILTSPHAARIPGVIRVPQEVIKEVVDAPDIGKRGEAYFAGQVVLALLIVFPPSFLRPLTDAAGWLGLAAGLGLVVWGQQSLGTNLSPLPKPRESSSLVATGAFEYVRHPM